MHGVSRHTGGRILPGLAAVINRWSRPMIPTKDSALVEWSTNANTRLTASPATYGTTAAVATQYDTLHDAYVLAVNNLNAARPAGVRSSPLAATRSSARLALLNSARPLYKTIQANTAVSDAA